MCQRRAACAYAPHTHNLESEIATRPRSYSATEGGRFSREKLPSSLVLVSAEKRRNRFIRRFSAMCYCSLSHRADDDGGGDDLGAGAGASLLQNLRAAANCLLGDL